MTGVSAQRLEMKMWNDAPSAADWHPPSADAASHAGTARTDRDPDGPCHAVRFYEDDDALTASVTGFLANGLVAGQPLLIIATAPRARAFAAGLAARGLEVAAFARTGHWTVLDARDLLEGFMRGGMPDEVLFRTQVGGAIARIAHKHPDACVRAYGEMVDLLWEEGLPQAALRLEELWNDLARTHMLSLLCAYAMGHFYQETHAPWLEQVCRLHTHVEPADVSPLHALRARTRSLEAEIEHRTRLEHELREALAGRRRAEEALRQRDAEREALLAAEHAARTDAELANRLKDEFLAILSHELRTPLNAILGWLRIINSGGAPDAATARRAMEVIERNAHVQLHLIEDLLDVSRIVTGKMQVKTEPVDLARVCAEAAESVRPAAAAKAITLKLQLDMPVNPAMGVTGDGARLQQVIWNLLANAIKFTPRDGAIVLRLEFREDDAVITVRDSGQGIAPAFLPHVFERFRQADTSPTRKQGGLGLGLAVVRYLVESHGGTVSAVSAGEDRGATFTVTLPFNPLTPASSR